ncbi:MAG: SDR family oxidoreductase [Litoreibacter sp.]|nr:SDR family oxidoreductase [Litoreibacter sp.]
MSQYFDLYAHSRLIKSQTTLLADTDAVAATLAQDASLGFEFGGSVAQKASFLDEFDRNLSAMAVASGTGSAVIDCHGLTVSDLPQTASNQALQQRFQRACPGAGPLPLETLLHLSCDAIWSMFIPSSDVLIRTLDETRQTDWAAIAPGAVALEFSASLIETAQALLDNPKATSVILERRGVFVCAGTLTELQNRVRQLLWQVSLNLNNQVDGRPISVSETALQIAPKLRGALSRESDIEGKPDCVILCHRHSPAIQEVLSNAALAKAVTGPNAGLAHTAAVMQDATLLKGQNDLEAVSHAETVPSVVLSPDFGIFGVGQTRQEAETNAAFAEQTLNVIGQCKKLRRSVTPHASCGPIRPRALGRSARQVVLVTGAGSGLGLETAKLFQKEGAELALFDINEAAVTSAAKELCALSVVCDVTSAQSVEAGLAKVVAIYGGVDVAISNAGAAFQGHMATVDDALFRKAFELNFWSHHLIARACVAVMQAQGTGGALVFNVTKQVLNPGPEFGPYGTSKSALMALVRQYAIEHGKDGITANAVNADRIRTGLLTDSFVAERAQARGVSQEDYMRGNLVRREVTGLDVAEAFLHLSLASKTTGAILTVDGGNTAAMVR